jgi:hypothetical protein
MRKPTKVDIIIIIVLGILSLGLIAADIYIGIRAFRELRSTHYGVCNVTECDKVMIRYTWPHAPYYNGSFNIPSTWTISCSDNIDCAYDDTDPYGSFGAWIIKIDGNGTMLRCIDGACTITESVDMKIFYGLIATTVMVFIIDSYIIYRGCTKKKPPRFDLLYQYDPLFPRVEKEDSGIL